MCASRLLSVKDELERVAAYDNNNNNNDLKSLWSWLQEAVDARDRAVICLHALLFVYVLIFENLCSLKNLKNF